MASCLVTKAEIDGKQVIRPYTPITGKNTTGHFDLLVKRFVVYLLSWSRVSHSIRLRCSYESGNMSKYLTDMKPGDTIEMKGPIKKYDYHANKKSEIGMIAGGTGIAPMWQVINVGHSSYSVAL